MFVCFLRLCGIIIIMREEVQKKQPFSLRPNQMREYFGLKADHVYKLVDSGQLIRGKHFLKCGRCTLIVVDEFIEFLKEQDLVGP